MKNILGLTKRQLTIVTVIFLTGMFLGWLIFGGHCTGNSSTEPKNNEIGVHADIWTCSMHPQVKKKEPGACPFCGMDLIPLENNGEELTSFETQMSESALKIAEVHTSIVKKQYPVKEVYLSGKVKADERLIASQTSHIPGRVEKLYIGFTGESVVKGQKLISIYSPKLITAQEELFEALKYQDSNPVLLESARKKLKLWKLTEEQIYMIEKKGKAQTELDILSDFSGVVTQRMVSVGRNRLMGF